MGKHTPGPWSHSWNGHYAEISTPCHSEYRGEVAYCHHVERGWGITREEAEANAKLIAAAPEMAGLLAKVHELWMAECDLENVMQEIAALHATATGETSHG